MIKYVIKGSPLSSKNTRPVYFNKATGKRFVGKSKKLKEYTEAALLQLKNQKKTNKGDWDYPIPDDVGVSFLIYVKDKRRRDLINFCQLPADLLQQSKVIEDDAQIISIDGSRLIIDNDNPRVEMYINII